MPLHSGDAVLFRDYDATDREALAAQWRSATKLRRLRLVVAGDMRLASRIGADGIHLPEWAIARVGGAARRWRQANNRRLFTVAAHRPTGLHRAAVIGADAALLAPVLSTTSHPETTFIGPLRFAAWVKQSPIPVYALGGVSVETAPRLRASEAVGFAAISALTPKPGD